MTETCPTLSHRVVRAWADMIAPFEELPDHPVDSSTRKGFHDFLRDAAGRLDADPSAFGLPSGADDAYEDWALLNTRPELIESMRRIRVKLDDLLTLLMNIGLAGQPVEQDSLFLPSNRLKLSPVAGRRLSQLGLSVVPADMPEPGILLQCTTHPGIFPAWRWLAVEASRTMPAQTRKGAVNVRFSSGLFSDTHPYARDLLLGLSRQTAGDSAVRLADVLVRRGYRLHVNRDNAINVDWVRSYGPKDEPLKGAWAERTHGGFSIEYDWTKRRPLSYALRVPAFRRLLERADAMSPQVRSFVVRQTKHCDGCGYCTQTDRTGRRPKAFMTVQHEGTHALCTMFPGFTFIWRRMDEVLADDILSFLAFIDDEMLEGHPLTRQDNGTAPA